MTRVRWFRADWPVNVRHLATRMRQYAFTEASPDGFLLDRARDDRIEGRYIEKFSYNESIVDPFGRELSFERISYRQVEFTLFRDFPQIEIRDAPRGLQSFTSRLLELTDFRVATSPLSVDVLKWIDGIARIVDSDITVDTMQLSGIGFTPAVTGSLLLKSRRDIRASLREIVGSKTHTIDKVRATWSENGTPVAIQINNNGSAKIDFGGADHFTLLRDSLPRPDRS
jgi:hypothetical protein